MQELKNDEDAPPAEGVEAMQPSDHHQLDDKPPPAKKKKRQSMAKPPERPAWNDQFVDSETKPDREHEARSDAYPRRSRAPEDPQPVAEHATATDNHDTDRLHAHRCRTCSAHAAATQAAKKDKIRRKWRETASESNLDTDTEQQPAPAKAKSACDVPCPA